MNAFGIDKKRLNSEHRWQPLGEPGVILYPRIYAFKATKFGKINEHSEATGFDLRPPAPRAGIVDNIQRALRSATNNDMVVPRSRLKFGERAFSIAAPRAWNSIPADLHARQHCYVQKEPENIFIP